MVERLFPPGVLDLVGSLQVLGLILSETRIRSWVGEGKTIRRSAASEGADKRHAAMSSACETPALI